MTSKQLLAALQKLQKMHDTLDPLRVEIGKALLATPLSEREISVLWQRFGVLGQRRSLGQVGESLQISRQRAQEIEVRALEKIETGGPSKRELARRAREAENAAKREAKAAERKAAAVAKRRKADADRERRYKAAKATGNREALRRAARSKAEARRRLVSAYWREIRKRTPAGKNYRTPPAKLDAEVRAELGLPESGPIK